MSSLQQPLLQSTSRVLKWKKRVAEETESLTYDPPTNRLRIQDHKEWQGRRHLYGYTGHTAVARVSTILSGILIGVVAVLIQNSIEQLVLTRNRVLQHYFQSSFGAALAMWLLFSVFTVGFTGFLVQIFAPKAAGAGVTLVMAFLNGADIRGLLSMPVFAMKFLGLICSRVAGLAVGPEGPMVHLGACVASMLCACEPWFLGLMSTRNQVEGPEINTRETASRRAAAGQESSSSRLTRASRTGTQREYIMKNDDHRELVSAGAAAGIAAAFGAPIGGVLFSLEEAATHWSRKIGWTCFLCTTCASFTLAQLHPRAQSGMLSFKADNPLTNRQWLLQAPFVILISVFGGLLGAAFNVLRKKLWPIRASRKRTLLRLAEAASVAAASVILMAVLAHHVGRCLPLPEAWDEDQVVRFACPKGHYNDLGSALMGSDVFVIRTLLNLGSESLPLKGSCNLASPCYFSWPSLAVLSVAFLVMMALASSICVPGGLFMPSIMVGGSFGALYGFALREYLPDDWDIQPGVYALLCGTAVLGGVFRSTFSLVVIVVEGTKGIDFLFGIIMAILVSNLVANKVLSDGVYESELERDGNVYYLRPEPPYALKGKTASDIMATPVVGLEAIVPLSVVRRVLKDTKHHGFPIYSSSDVRKNSTGMGHLHGFILRSQLEVILQRRAYCSAAGDYLSSPPDVSAFELSINLDMRAAQRTISILTETAQTSGWEVSQNISTSSPSRKGSQCTDSQPTRWSAPQGINCGMVSRAGVDLVRNPGPSKSWSDGGGVGDRIAIAVSKDHVDIECLPVGEDAEPREGPLTPMSLTLEDAAAAAGFFSSQGYSNSVMDDLVGNVAEGHGSASDQGSFLNLEPFMERASLVVQPETLGTKVHHLFVAMSLRHLCVVDSWNNVVGIITRKDLDHAAGEGWWRINKLAPEPHHSPELRRSQSWLAISMSAPRRFLSSIQAALSPIASPLTSLQGTPRASPCTTPRGLSTKSREFTSQGCNEDAAPNDHQPEGRHQLGADLQQNPIQEVQPTLDEVATAVQLKSHVDEMPVAAVPGGSPSFLHQEVNVETGVLQTHASMAPESHIQPSNTATPFTSAVVMGSISEETELAVEGSSVEQMWSNALSGVRTLHRRQSTLRAFGSVAVAVDEDEGEDDATHK